MENNMNSKNMSSEQAMNAIAKRIDPFLEKISNTEKKDTIKMFWLNEIVPYFKLWDDLGVAMTEKTVSEEDASLQIIKATNDVLQKGDKIEEFINDKDIIKELKMLFRISGASYGLSSKAVRHALEKPGGYPGD